MHKWLETGRILDLSARCKDLPGASPLYATERFFVEEL